MSISDSLDLRPVINAAGTLTRLGGTYLLPKALEAMREAAGMMLPVEEVQAQASGVIARLTGAEAGYVVSGASAGLTLAACACLAGLEVRRMDLLPDLPPGVPRDIIIPRPHRNSYDHAFRMAGARLIEVGMDDRAVGCGVRTTEVEEIREAVTSETAAIAWVAGPWASPPLDQVAGLARQLGLPLIVDAAGQLPPPGNLSHFTAQGADLVVFSGGKALRGPQGTGFIAGRKDLIASIALQHLDMDVTFELWQPPDIIPVRQLSRAPRHGMGRGFKVSKEEIIGLLVALEHFHRNWKDDREGWREILAGISQEIGSSAGVREVVLRDQGHGFPQLEIHLEESSHMTAPETALKLRENHPRVFVGEGLLDRGVLLIHPVNLDPDSAAIVTERLLSALSRS